jgi:hypothetical protein
MNRRPAISRILRIILVVSLLSGCTPLASVKQIPVHYAATGRSELLAAEKELADASRIENRQPLVALAKDLAAAKISANLLEGERNNTSALSLYNFAVARGVENVQRARVTPWRAR